MSADYRENILPRKLIERLGSTNRDDTREHAHVNMFYNKNIVRYVNSPNT